MSKEKSSLGRGLDSLLGERKEAPKNNTPNEISLDQLTPGEFQPRTKMHKETLEELADSIKNQGVLQPLLVREKASGRYEIIAGERRWRAAQIAGLKSVPVSIKKVNNNDAAKIALVENLQREDLNAMDQSRGLQRLQMEFNLSQEELAKSIGKSRSTVTNLLRLSKLDKKVQGYLESGEIDRSQSFNNYNRRGFYSDLDQRYHRVDKDSFSIRFHDSQSEEVVWYAFSRFNRSNTPQDQQPDYAKNENRSIRPDVVVLEAVCTHLSCAPTFYPQIGVTDFDDDWQGGFFCPCHGSKFDLAGRVYSGVPAPTNMLVPPHYYESDDILVIGQDGAKA